MSLSRRCDYVGLGFRGETPFYNIPVDYGPAMEDGALTFHGNAYGSCPVDTGYLQSTIGSSADHGGFDAWADAPYAEYVESWSGFFNAAFEQALSTTEAHCMAIWVDALQEEFEMIMAEREQVLEELERQEQEKEKERKDLEEEKSEKEEELEEAEEEEAAEEEEEDGGGGGGFAGFLVSMLMAVIDALVEAIFSVEEEQDAISDQINEANAYYDDILGYY